MKLNQNYEEKIQEKKIGKEGNNSFYTITSLQHSNQIKTKKNSKHNLRLFILLYLHEI